MPKFLPFFFLLNSLFFSCARNNFFQKTALTDPAEINAVRSGHIPDSLTVTVGRHYDKGRLQTLFFGKHYRKIWATPVKLPVFKLQEAKGGLTPVSMGGGFQTTSLTLKDKNGKLFVLRSLDKDPQKTLPKGLRNTFLVNVIRDQTSAANPFAPLVLPPLSAAAGLYYSSPTIYYVAENDSSFGNYAARVNGKVMLLEEKFDGEKNLNSMFGPAVDLVDSEDMLKERFEDNHHLIDQDFFARNRLFDILIGDWDRHEGQWQWAVNKTGKTYFYKAIPKDRDQTFYHFNDGIITWLASNPLLLKKFQTFHERYGYLPGWLYNARFIDARALNEVTKESWVKQAEEIKTALTDDLIAEAFKALPQPVFAQTGPVTISRLKSRRDKLPEAAAEIYAILAEKITVAGTDEAEKFVVKRLPSGETLVEVFRMGTADTAPFYSRTFKPKETREITLHGLGGKDEFEISEEARDAITLQVYGGEGEDKLSDTSKVKGCSKKTKVYDTKWGMDMEVTGEIKKKLSRNVAINAYDREGL
jgi:transcriptional regulator of met regulon